MGYLANLRKEPVFEEGDTYQGDSGEMPGLYVPAAKRSAALSDQDLRPVAVSHGT
jgi:hypothetical protein